MKNLPALTGLRFFAAFAVVLDHAGLPEQIASMRLFNLGAEAVSLFFVLSGFVLAYNYQSGFDKAGFYIARVARIYPAYLLGFLIALPFYPGADVLFASAKGLTLTQAWQPSSPTYINPPSWTLSVEAFFYFVFPFVPVWRLSKRQALVSIIVLSALTFSGYALLKFGAVSYGAALQAPIFRLPEFLIGMAAARLYLLGVRVPKYAAWLAIIGIAATSSFPYELRHNGLLAPLFALLILSLARGSAFLEKWRIPGEASYALYILHWPILQVFKTMPAPWYVVFAAYTFSAVVLSIVAWAYIEKPSRRFIVGSHQTLIRPS